MKTAAFLGLLLCAAPALAQQTPPVVPTVVTRGEAVLKRAPDLAYVALTVLTRSSDPKQASAANARVMTAVQAGLRGLGLPADAIRTQGYQLTPEYDWVNGRQVTRGYSVTNSVEVRVDRLDQLAEVIDTGIAAGATSAGAIRFDLRDRSGAEREALKSAVADARARAEAAAAGAGLSIARVIRIDETGDQMPPPQPMQVFAARAEMKADAPTPIEPGEIEIRVSVTLTAELK